ncbi:MAG: hypothetical protein V3V49_05720, partial [Candidatus Krumholzibacteria bacterium]
MLRISGDPAQRMNHMGPPTSRPVPRKHLRTVKRALWIIEKKMKGKPRCDDIFRKLDGGLTFTGLINNG